MVTYTKLCSRGKDFQLADRADEITTAIQGTVYPALEWGTKTAKTTLL